MLPPRIVNIDQLHRQTSSVIGEAAASDRPIFVTQFALVSAVLLPRVMYERLLRAAEAAPASADGPGAGGEPREQNGLNGEATARSPLESPLAVFGTLPPGTRFLTRQGISIDAKLAEWLMEDGEEVRPILSRWGDEEEEDEAAGSGEGGEKRIAWR